MLIFLQIDQYQYFGKFREIGEGYEKTTTFYFDEL